MISTSNPSLNTYINLRNNHSHTLACPCSTMTIPYHKLISFSPMLHQICSSDFITDRWISSLEQCTGEYLKSDWRNRASKQFRLLSKLCQLANQTVTIAVNEFLSQSFVVSNVLTKVDFDAQIEKVLNPFYQSTIIYFRHLIDVVNLHMHVDKPLLAKSTTRFSKIAFYFTIYTWRETQCFNEPVKEVWNFYEFRFKLVDNRFLIYKIDDSYLRDGP